MMKLKLNFASSDEIISREEMKQVYGGYMSGSDDTGSGCYWYRCVCSEPESIMWGSTSSQYVRVERGADPGAEALKECSGYRQADCVQDKEC